MNSFEVDLIEPPKTHTYTTCLPPLKYVKLPTPTSIRLLKIDRLPSIKDNLDLFRPLTCSLVIKDLNDRPEYDALSYTWGDPLGRESSSAVSTAPGGWATTPFGLTCNGQRAKVTTNLHTALMAIRYGLGGFQQASTPQSHYIWVDQICINQRDIAEKNSQVQLMGRIYRQCVRVQIWLGGHQQDIKDLNDICESLAPVEWTRGWKYKSFDIWNPQKCEDLGIRPITREKARGMFDFFNRAWFKRSWIIQEAMVLFDSVALCGLHVIPFCALWLFMNFLDESGWFAKLYIGVKHPYPENMAKPIFFRQISGISHRLGMGSYRGHDKYWNRPFSLNTVTRMFRSSQATDPRDKIYAFIGISENDANRKGPQLIPDYSKTVDDVYINATKLMMSSKGFNLDCFSQKEDEARRKIKSLPSWVPDFSVAIGHNPLAWSNRLWAACGTPPGMATNHVRYLPSNCVELMGVQVDSVRLWKGSVVQPHVYSTGPEVSFQTCELLQISANDVVELMALVPETSIIGPPSSDLSLIDEYCEKNQYMSYEIPSGIMEVPEQPIYYQSRSEVFWGTMISDIGHESHPAEEDCGRDIFEEMEDVLYERMSRLLNRWPLDSKIVEKWKICTNEVMKEFTNLQILRGKLPYGTTDIQNPKDFAEARSVALSAQEKGVDYQVWRNLLSYISNLSKRGRGLLEVNTRRLSIIHAMAAPARGRGLLVTAKGRLGWGLLSSREGDEVWILKGFQVPCLLRPMGDERYKLVGEAYVHGIMHGEALEGLDVNNLSPVVIV
ncbi:hypothetical protein H9Q72_014271 [Fusarium xylarioides]|uniref:Heterokaryon incompatibility domain-containing protein n=1 Tax=Fusarium xylarioides TaxID=221167 RepID=A0A9P7KXV8_9HYPO|nr:hypothetical protein H9Q72_014271 [Fusarium xylarioides]